MLANEKLMAFLATTDAARSKTFYQEVLGLRLVADEEWALVFDANGTMLRIQKVREFAPPPHTALGWQVHDLKAAMSALRGRNVSFERYPFLKQDETGAWSSPSGASVAWFKDPDGNLLSLTEF